MGLVHPERPEMWSPQDTLSVSVASPGLLCVVNFAEATGANTATTNIAVMITETVLARFTVISFDQAGEREAGQRAYAHPRALSNDSTNRTAAPRGTAVRLADEAQALIGAYSGVLSVTTTVSLAFLAWTKPRIDRTSRMIPAVTMPQPAHTAIVATVHQP